MGGGAQDTAAMQQAGQRIEQAGTVANGEKQRINQAASAVLSTWQGNAANSFQRAISNFEEKIQAQLTILDGLREKMGLAQTQYEVSGDEANQSVTDVEAMLN